MKQLTFDHIYHGGKLVLEDKLFKHYHDTTMTLLYDRNFIGFKSMPSISTFKKIEATLRKYHLKYDQNHLRFTFPSNEFSNDKLITYLEGQGYAVGQSELYAIHPTEFPTSPHSLKVDIELVTLRNLESYLSLQYWQDFSYGTEFAKQKQVDYRQRFENESFHQVLALYQDVPVGSVDMIVSEEVAEIDNLFVEAAYQRRGIGAAIQSYVMKTFPDHIIILVADGKDTAKDMYQKQNYHYLGYQYEALKV